MADSSLVLRINRAPVLTLWAAVVAQALGFRPEEALTLGKALAGVTAHAKGVRLGLFEPGDPGELQVRREQLAESDTLSVRLMGRELAVQQTKDGLRAVQKGQPIKPEAVEKYLKGKFGQDLEAVRTAMEQLAGSLPPGELARRAFRLYEQVRPLVPENEAGWGAAGELRLARLAELQC